MENRQAAEWVIQEKPIKAETTTFQMPDLIDTSGPVDALSTEDFLEMQSDQQVSEPEDFSFPYIWWFVWREYWHWCKCLWPQKRCDPFADVSFHTNGNKENVADIFSGMNVDKQGANEVHFAANSNTFEQPFDIFGPNSEILQPEGKSWERCSWFNGWFVDQR